MVQLQLRIVSSTNRTQRTIQALRSLMIPAQLARGCGGCWLYVDATDSRCLCYMEEWANRSDLEREMHSPRFSLLLSIMEDAPNPPCLEFRFIPEIRGLDYIEEICPVNENR